MELAVDRLLGLMAPTSKIGLMLQGGRWCDQRRWWRVGFWER